MFFPDYNNSFFPLFLDIQTVFIFIPSYSILFYGIFIHLIKIKVSRNTLLENNLANKFIICLYTFVASAILLYIQDFYSMKFKVFLVLFSIVLGFLITTVLDILACKKIV